MIKLIKRLFSGRPRKEKSAEAASYPDKIIIATRFSSGKFIWYSTDNLTLLPAGIDDRLLGETLIRHIHESRSQPADAEEMKSMGVKYREKTRITSARQANLNAKYLSVYLSGKSIRIEPFKYRKSIQSFLRLPDAIVTIDTNSNPEAIGRQIRQSWENCTSED